MKPPARSHWEAISSLMDDRRRRALKACDACKRRKVRCNGEDACQQCLHFNIKCVYTPVIRGRPRKGAASRGSVIQECRQNAKRGLQITSPTSPTSIHQPLSTIHLEVGFFMNLLPNYVSAVYPVNPVITEDEIIACIEQMHTNRDAASFCYAFAAVTINLTRTNAVIPASPGTRDQISSLLTRSFDQLDPMVLHSSPSLIKIMRNVFLEICLMGLQKGNLAFFYLREAIAMLQMFGVDSGDPSYPEEQKLQMERAYWECFVHERFTALTDYKPTCLQPLALLPQPDPTLDAGIEIGWNNIVRTFLLVDEPFLNFWVGDRTLIPIEWFEKKQEDLDDNQWQYEVDLLSEMQQADLIITRQWLRTLTWQMALTNVLLSSDPQSSALSLTMPLRLSSQLRDFLSTLTPLSVGIHGSGILHKLIEITTTIADVVIQMPCDSREDMFKRADDVLFLKEFVFAFPRVQEAHRMALLQRIDQMMEKYPEIAEMERQFPGGRVQSVLV